ncbi:hypothetical protein HGA07_07885 [Nocardia veterana]|uniref:Uncharacterized protein n=1 Tax=Nocardia veterana TaxID=132249 RepID=A0A7X6LXC5_9NOCA|nr:hypothetical protein [Nocardia veterana]
MRKHCDRYGGNVPHDSTPASEPVLLSLSVPTPERADLVHELVRPPSANPQAPVLDLDLPDVEVAEFLVGAAHSDTGFVASTESGARAVAVVAATVAALCGEDIRTALTSPDIEFLRGLSAPAVQALREVLLAIETTRPDEVNAALRVLVPGP